MDYAEQIRYRSNVIVPPLLAGTLQCTRDKLEGGDFQVSLEGISHYQKHGYKAKKLALNAEQAGGKGDMERIPYRFNQMICHLGNLPHSSTKVESIRGDQERVIVGFNVFCDTAGPYVQRAPEHSDQFRRTIKLQRYVSRMTNKKDQTMSFQLLKKNRALTKLLVLAKRQRIKDEYNRSRQRLAEDVPRQLPATVAALMARFSSGKDGCNILSNDVRVFLHHQIQQGHLKIMNGYMDSVDGIVPLEAELALV